MDEVIVSTPFQKITIAKRNENRICIGKGIETKGA
jgi:hypothetical protein